MTDTGMIKQLLAPRARKIIFGSDADSEIKDDMSYMARVDLAHVLMLKECGLLETQRSSRIIRGILELREEQFSSLRGREAPRGLFLMYESELMRRIGAEDGGCLHIARSRNDLKATVLRMRLREVLLNISEEIIRLEAVLLGRARAHSRTVMAAHTQFQPAVPSTYGHYLLGVAQEIGRAFGDISSAYQSLMVCPLGAGAVSGTDLPINPTLTARLLGFNSGVRSSVDAVASRDVVTRALAASAQVSMTLSRLATDLQLWSTAEFDQIEFPDDLVGSSSLMPQKRNAFLLEHIKAKVGHVIGAWSASASIISSTPFTNSVESGTEAVLPMWPALDTVMDAVVLSRMVVFGSKPNVTLMRQHASFHGIVATAIANHLVKSGAPFRRAHTEVGVAVQRAAATGQLTAESIISSLREAHVEYADNLRSSDFDPEKIVDRTVYGGGPGAGSFRHAHEESILEWNTRRKDLSRARAGLRSSSSELDARVEALLSENSSVR